MSENLIRKVEELFLQGKITNEEKEKLLKAIELEKELKVREVEIRLRTEDIEIIGKEHLNEIVFEKGYLNITKEKDKVVLEEPIGYSGGSIRLDIPYKSQVRLKSISSDIKIFDIVGFVEVQSVSSDVSLKNISNTIILSLVSGDVDLEKTFGKVNVTTKTGDIRIRDSKISAFLKTYSGDIVGLNTQFENSRFNTFNGDVVFEACSFISENFLNTHFGDVVVKKYSKVFGIEISTLLSNVKGFEKISQNLNDFIKIETKFGDLVVED